MAKRKRRRLKIVHADVVNYYATPTVLKLWTARVEYFIPLTSPTVAANIQAALQAYAARLEKRGNVDISGAKRVRGE